MAQVNAIVELIVAVISRLLVSHSAIGNWKKRQRIKRTDLERSKAQHRISRMTLGDYRELLIGWPENSLNEQGTDAHCPITQLLRSWTFGDRACVCVRAFAGRFIKKRSQTLQNKRLTRRCCCSFFDSLEFDFQVIAWFMHRSKRWNHISANAPLTRHKWVVSLAIQWPNLLWLCSFRICYTYKNRVMRTNIIAFDISPFQLSAMHCKASHSVSANVET